MLIYYVIGLVFYFLLSNFFSKKVLQKNSNFISKYKLFLFDFILGFLIPFGSLYYLSDKIHNVNIGFIVAICIIHLKIFINSK